MKTIKKDDFNLTEITDILKRNDEILAKVIADIGPCYLKRGEQGFCALVNSIISQQLSKSASKSIGEKLTKLLGTDIAHPALFNRVSERELKDIGLSQNKAKYIKELSKYVQEGWINFSQLEDMDDENVIKTLTQFKGVGRWTAEMYLMFSMNRLDVFPIDDVAIRNAISSLYGIPKPEIDEKAREVADNWKPYRTVVCWYLYRWLDGSR